ncbi:MAG: hypothetical protein Q7R86_03095 [bacterium]|nr:hypothetical protein [bacterium]
MILGHQLLVKNLKELADLGKLAHGYLFFGPEGVGKFLVAQALANYFERKNFDLEPGILNDVLVILPDEKNTISIDQVREIRNFLFQRPNLSLRRTVIINDADNLTVEAQNSLLKITEEPPEAGLLILVVRDPEFLRETLISRLNKIYFSNVKTSEVEEWLKRICDMRHETWSREEIKEAAEKSMGRPGLALRILEDEEFQKLLKTADKFLKVSPSQRKDFIKDLLDSPIGGDFSILNFLDAVAIELSLRKRPPSSKDYGRVNENDFNLWHRVLRLKKVASYFNLNPRIQLQALLESSK